MLACRSLPDQLLVKFRRHVLTAHWIPFTTLKYCQVLTRSGCSKAKSDSNQLSCLENICSNMCLYISVREELSGRCPGRAEAGSNGELPSCLCAKPLENEESVFVHFYCWGLQWCFQTFRFSLWDNQESALQHHQLSHRLDSTWEWDTAVIR